MVDAQLEADLGEHAVARVRYRKFEWDDTYGVGNTLLANVSPYDTTAPYNGGLYYNSDARLRRPNPAVADPYTAEHQSHRGRHAGRPPAYPSRLHLGPRRRDAEVFRRLPGVPVPHGLRQRRNLAHRRRSTLRCRPVAQRVRGRFRGSQAERRFRWCRPGDAAHVRASGATRRPTSRRSRGLLRGIAALVVERDQPVLERRRRAAVDRGSVPIRQTWDNPQYTMRTTIRRSCARRRARSRIRSARNGSINGHLEASPTPASARSTGRSPTSGRSRSARATPKIRRKVRRGVATSRRIPPRRSARPRRLRGCDAASVRAKPARACLSALALPMTRRCAPRWPIRRSRR